MPAAKPHSNNPRKGRFSHPNHYYFLTTSIADRRRIFNEKKHATIVLNAIHWLHTAERFNVAAAVVMPDHLHLVGQLGDNVLDKVMHTLKSYTAHRLVEAGVKAPIWQDGYHDHGLRNDEDYCGKVRYVLQNPLRAGLVRRIEDYPYVIFPDWWRD
jgi:putative transposase